jgi:heat shock protein HtpX
MPFLSAMVISPLVLITLVMIGWACHVPGVTRFARLFTVSLGMTALVSAPVWTWSVLACARLASWREIPFALGVTATLLGILAHCYGAPVRLQGARKNLPLLDDPAITSRVADLSARFGIRPPCLRWLGSLGGSLDVLAWAGCLPTPTVVVTDGLLHRLSENERDAILAHELGHLATGSLWLHAAVPSLAGVVAVLASVVVPIPVSVAISFCALVGLRRIVSRPVELACDRRAAEVIGDDVVISALAKTHAAHSVRADTVIGFLVYATATHPHPEVRLAALRRRATALETAAARADQRVLIRHRVGGAAALVVWGATLAWAVVVGDSLAIRPWVYAALLAVTIAPTVFILLAHGRELRRRRELLGRDWNTLTIWIGLALVVAGMLGTVSRLAETQPYSAVLSPALLWAGAAVLAGYALRHLARRRLRVDLETALRERDPSRALALARAKPKLVRRDPVLRLNLAVAHLLAGERETAINQTSELVRDKPQFKVAQLNLSLFLLDVDPTQSLAVAADLEAALPKDPSPLIIAARALRRLGRLDGAADTIQRAIALQPDNGVVRAVAAAVKADLGDLEAARQLVRDAAALAPGDVFVRMAEAQIALAAESPERAQNAVETAAAAVRANPFALLERDLQTLQERLHTRRSCPATDPSPATLAPAPNS